MTKPHIKGIYEFLWGMTDKSLNVWLCLVTSSQSRPMSEAGGILTSVICVGLKDDHTCGLSLHYVCATSFLVVTCGLC